MDVGKTEITMSVSEKMVRVVALQAKIESKKAWTAAMHAANSARVNLGAALAYGENDFLKLEKELIAISDELEIIADEMKAKQEQERDAENLED